MWEPFIQIGYEIAKQSPTIFLLGLLAWDYRKREIAAVKKLEKQQKAAAKELKETKEGHANDIKQLHDDWRKESNETADTLDRLADALEKKK